ncbi:hypothetical protein ACH5RR_032116 [Cinchona calisaya]|uniref:Uncharacterized protein n=1 Tax=Cinchona calisaya TaxID=153742 RepID=A0ABD2YJV2_9GENT
MTFGTSCDSPKILHFLWHLSHNLLPIASILHGFPFNHRPMCLTMIENLLHAVITMPSCIPYGTPFCQSPPHPSPSLYFPFYLGSKQISYAIPLLPFAISLYFIS